MSSPSSSMEATKAIAATATLPENTVTAVPPTTTVNSSEVEKTTTDGGDEEEKEDAERKAKEEAMKKKRERLKAWQEAKKAKEDAASATTSSGLTDSTTTMTTVQEDTHAMDVQENEKEKTERTEIEVVHTTRKGFSLDDDEDDDVHVGDIDKSTSKVDEILNKLPPPSSPFKQNNSELNVSIATAGKKGLPFSHGKSSMSSSSSPWSIQSASAVGDTEKDDGVDPLDAFMSSLDGAAEQVGSALKRNNSTSISDGGTLEDFMAEAGDSGSNFITLEDIMGMTGSTNEENGVRKKHMLGWESDSQMETDEQQEEREEEEHRLFIEGLRKKRIEEEEARDFDRSSNATFKPMKWKGARGSSASW